MLSSFTMLASPFTQTESDFSFLLPDNMMMLFLMETMMIKLIPSNNSHLLCRPRPVQTHIQKKTLSIQLSEILQKYSYTDLLYLSTMEPNLTAIKATNNKNNN